MAEYRLTPAAERDLEDIWTYTVRKWDIEQANRYTDIILSTFTNWQNGPKQPQLVTTFDQVIVDSRLNGIRFTFASLPTALRLFGFCMTGWMRRVFCDRRIGFGWS